MRDGRRWQQWTEQDARAAFGELARTGESVAGFARRKGISTQRLAYWRKRLVQPATEFVAVELPVATAAASKWIEIAAGGVVVRVPEGIDVDRVARLVEAIGRRLGGAC
jgi:transposase-like protein